MAARQQGEALFRSKTCIACHAPGGVPLPDLSRHSVDDIRAVLEAPPSGMPTFDISTDDLLALAAYLKATFGGEPSSGTGVEK